MKKKDPIVSEHETPRDKMTDQELEEEFNSTVDEKFVTLLSDGYEVELCVGGRQRNVTLDNLEEYLNLLV